MITDEGMVDGAGAVGVDILHLTTAALFNRIAGHRIEGRGVDGFSRVGSKTGVMPRAANYRSIEQAFGERTSIMRALGAHGIHGCALADQQHRFSVEVSEEHASVRKLARCRSNDSQIGPGQRLSTGLAHGVPPSCLVLS
jgi:hypothetical protein